MTLKNLSYPNFFLHFPSSYLQQVPKQLRGMYSCVVYVTNRTKSPTCRKTVHRKTHGAVEQDIHWFGFRTNTSQKILVQLQSLVLETPNVEFLANELKRLACEQALQGTLVVGWEKEGELATTSLEFEFHLQFSCGSPSTDLT